MGVTSDFFVCAVGLGHFCSPGNFRGSEKGTRIGSTRGRRKKIRRSVGVTATFRLLRVFDTRDRHRADSALEYHRTPDGRVDDAAVQKLRDRRGTVPVRGA